MEQTLEEPQVQTLDEMKEIIATSYEGNKFLHLKSYRSNNGAVDTMIVQMLGPTGYKDCIVRSLEMFENGEVDLNVEDGLEKGAEAATTLCASWAKSVGGLHKPRNYKDKELNLQEVDELGFSLNDRGQAVIRNVVIWVRISEVTVPSKKSKNPLVRAKKEITFRTPMGGYRGQLNLHPDKVELVGTISDKSVPAVAIAQWPDLNQRYYVGS